MNKFPQVRIRGYDQGTGAHARGDQPDRNQLEVHQRERHAVEIAGAHTFKFGGDWRKMGIDTFIPGDGAGFRFRQGHDVVGRRHRQHDERQRVRLVPARLSIRTDGPVTFLSVSTPLNVFTHYFGGYAQDDWRINSKVTLTYGLRLEHERG